ncbi:MAG: hybrid sensor histidine kinase/response regulator [Campylobacterota bacterium]|nr:hybrid sensor histidine kinase/response regulator [Campylobacterota bacterium]
METSILIVDDIEANRISLRSLFEEYLDGVDVIMASSGEEALEIVYEQDIDLIILDIQMPGLNGFETAKFIKENQNTKHIPIIFLTAAFVKEEFINHGFKIGAIDYLTKPIENGQLISKIQLYIKLFNKNKELEQKIEYIEQTQQKLIESEKMAALGSLVAGVAHEVNTPLGLAITSNSILEDECEKIENLYRSNTIKKSDLEKFIENVKEASKLLSSNLNRAATLIKSFKQISVDQSSEEKRNFNLKEYIQEIFETYHSQIKKQSLILDINCSESISLNSYPGALSQVISNLIQNSLTHAFDKKDEGKISLNVEDKGKEVIIVFSDDGKGLEPSIKEKVFEPFITTKRNEGGSGLGMNIIYNLIHEKLQGDIKIESIKDQGTIITINIPKESKDARK